MNKFPRWWNSTVTVYNRHEDPVTQLVTWKRTVLTNCFWKVNLENNYSSDKVSKTYINVIVCRIPKNSKYVSAYNWKKLDTARRNTKFTLQVGDIIVNGKVTDEIDEYTKGKRSNEVIDKYKDLGIIRVEMIGDNSDETRNIPHYLAGQGV